MRGTKGVVVVLTALVVATWAPNATAAGFDEQQIASLRATVQASMAEQRVPGVNVGVWAPGRSWTESFGIADTTTGAAMSQKDTVRIASISKTFTGIATLRLVNRGKLRLNDTLDEYVKGIPNGDQISIRKLSE
jgi:D-alanyl-D-alanine carboxypeptidase